MLGHILLETLDEFKEAFDEALNGGEGFSVAAHSCTDMFMTQFDEQLADVVIQQENWDSSNLREKLRRDIDAHVAAVRAAKLSELTNLYEEKLNNALSGDSGPFDALLDRAGDNTWLEIRELLRHETESAVSEFSAALSSFNMDEQTTDNMLTCLEEYARGVVESKMKEEAARVLIRMKDRFTTLFTLDPDSMPRVWRKIEDIRAITKMARSSSLKLLAVMAAIRLDGEADNIEETLALALMDNRSGAVTNENSISDDPLASSTWEEVPPSKTLITPVQCKFFWRQFISETQHTIAQAIAAQQAYNRWPPPSVILNLVLLGFMVCMRLLRGRNPLYLVVCFVPFLLIHDLWFQLDISAGVIFLLWLLCCWFLLVHLR